MAYVDPAEKSMWCPARQQWRPLLSCLRCPRFPCQAIDADRQRTLAESPFVTIDAAASGFIQRRVKMYILKYNDGRLAFPDEDFDPENLDWKIMEDVAEVLYVSKVFVPQIRLVARPLEERARIRKSLSRAEVEAEEAETPQEEPTEQAQEEPEVPASETAMPEMPGEALPPEEDKPKTRRRKSAA